MAAQPQTHDYGEIGRIESELMRMKEKHEQAKLSGDPLEAHNLEHQIDQLEKELRAEERQPRRLQI